MKTTFYIIALLLSTIILMNCKSQINTSDSYKKQWMLVSFKDYSKEFFIQNKAEMNLTTLSEESNSGSAYMGCNNIMINANFKNNGEVIFSDLGSTMMYCEGKMKLEKEFLYSLPKMNKYTIKGHYLTLSDEEGNEMKFVAADWD